MISVVRREKRNQFGLETAHRQAIQVGGGEGWKGMRSEYNAYISVKAKEIVKKSQGQTYTV